MKFGPDPAVYVRVPAAVVVFAAFPDLSFHDVIVAPFVGTTPVARGSAPSNQTLHPVILNRLKEDE